MTDRTPNDTAYATISFAGRSYAQSLSEFEKAYFAHLLGETKGNHAAAARMAVLSENTFRTKVKRYNFRTFFRAL